jgi:2'-5' RNA ligase
MPDSEDLKPARLFVGLWPTAAVRERLAAEARRLHKALGGRQTRPGTIHLTLVFIGDLERTRLPELVAALTEVRQSRFEIVFDQARCWAHNRIAYLAPAQPPNTLFDLVAELESVLARLAVPFDRRPYKAHITLIRKANCQKGIPALGRDSVSPEWGGFAPIRWSAEDFVLVESVLSPDGADYRIVERFPLL